MQKSSGNATWMIIGALSDLGRATAWQMAHQGIQLILADQNQEALFTLSDELEAKGYIAPLLVAIDLAHLEKGCYQLTEQLAHTQLTLTGWVWTGYHLKTPTPMLHIALNDWQTELTTNLTYPFWLLKACFNASAINTHTQVWFATPHPQAFTHTMTLSSIIWENWLAQLKQEWGDSAPELHVWHLPRVADRIHRRIWPLAPLEDFIALDDVVLPWISQVISSENQIRSSAS